MKKIESIQRLFYSIVTAGFILGTAANAWDRGTPYYMPSADDTTFELDGNIADEAAPPPEKLGDDWSNIKAPLNNAFADTGIIHDPVSTSIFTGGGSKDVRPIGSWKHTNGSVPDKNEIINAAAAAYNVIDSGDTGDNNLIIYLHGDRLSNDGDAQMGVWFFQDRVVAKGDGTFSGEHRVGDLLMLANFVNGGANATVKLYEWNPDYPKNLKQIAEGQGGTGTDFYYFATSNVGPTPSWNTYTPKTLVDGYPIHTYPENSFFEGAINVSWIFNEKLMPCFSTFLMETRSSHKPDAQLKDFVIGSLDTCKLEVSKTCLSSVLNQDTYTTLDHTYSYTVTNSGFGKMDNVVLHDDAGTPSSPGDDLTFDIGTLLPNTSATDTYKVFGSSLNPPTNSIYASSDTIVKSEVAQDTCAPVALSPTISVTKDCNQTLESLEGKTVVKLNYSGDVCNESQFGDANATKLINVTVVDDKDLEDPITVPYTLYPRGDTNTSHLSCYSYVGDYHPAVPSDPSGDPCNNGIENTVTATGEYLTGGDLNEPETNTTMTTFSATCGLCDSCK